MKSTENFLVGKYAILRRQKNGDFWSYSPILSHGFSLDVRPWLYARTSIEFVVGIDVAVRLKLDEKLVKSA